MIGTLFEEAAGCLSSDSAYLYDAEMASYVYVSIFVGLMVFTETWPSIVDGSYKRPVAAPSLPSGLDGCVLGRAVMVCDTGDEAVICWSSV